MTEPLRFGIVGCGVIGPLHAQAITSLPDVILCAVADRVDSQAQKLANKYDGVRAYTSLEDMLQREKLDVVTICTPSGLHGAHACQVMRAGCHVLVEKPMEIRATAIAEMVQVQREWCKAGCGQSAPL